MRTMQLLIFYRNVRLSLGICIAWVISLLSMLSWIRRLPTLVILARRRLRRAVVAGAVPAKADTTDPQRLWHQSNALPGNRGEGFRFSYLVPLMVLTPLYLWLELSFGVNLLDIIGSDVTPEETDAIEHWGRLISGLAVALVFLKGWWAQCEKWDRAWSLRIIVSVVIALVSIAITWKVQDTVIEFHVQRTNAAIAVSLTALLVAVAFGIWSIRFWLQRSMTLWRHSLGVTILGLLVLMSLGIITLNNLGSVVNTVSQWLGRPEALVKDLGRERQQAATLALTRRAMQQEWYTIADGPIEPSAVNSAEGKAALALLPIIGATLDQERLAADRPALLQKLMLKDWMEINGDQVRRGYDTTVADLQRMHAGPYLEASEEYAQRLHSEGQAKADEFWARRSSQILDGPAFAPGLSYDEFGRTDAAKRYLRNTLGCFDCEFTHDMPREEFLAEFYKYNQANNLRMMQERFESAEHFERGIDGENAARAYWVPIWALLFSMVGAFTHIFKIAFTVTEYVVRRTLLRAQAADSRLAGDLVRNAQMLLAAALVLLALFIYFFDNRVTGSPNYQELRKDMWKTNPVIGAIASHWTINAQGLIYPFTQKIRPDWLQFKSDPFTWLGITKPPEEEEY